nr:GAF domain-containing protein [uncultured Cupriavidus sp.]
MDKVQQLEAQIGKLQRRLQRERQARVEAESIAEKGLRELYDKQQQLQLLESIANAANHAISVAEALQFAVQTVCQFAGWQVGHAYLAEGAGKAPRLLATSIWHGIEEAQFHDFYQVTEPLDFHVGDGLPGRVLASAEPAWVRDIAQDVNFIRAGVAQRAGLKAAIAFRCCSAIG